MHFIVQRRLPERLAGYFPPIAVELLVGLLTAVVAVAARLPLGPVLGERAPYVFVFLATVAACLLAGWRSGLVALLSGQLLTWYVVVEPQWSFAIVDLQRAAGVLVGTLSEVLILIVVAIYQREADRAAIEREQRMQLLEQALREIDHRTRNNYQRVVSLLQLQANRVSSVEAKEALELAADRIEAVSIVQQKLAVSSVDVGTIRLGELLRELCSQIQRGLSGNGILVECRPVEVAADAEKAIGISIIINELITNALKHAFRDRPKGIIEVQSGLSDGALELMVRDNGSGLRPQRPFSRQRFDGGLGTKLVESLIHQLGARHEVRSSEGGTEHRILIPQIA